MIEIQSLSVVLNQRKILDGIDLTLRKGENTFLLGRSGVGKSVFLKTIVGLIPYTSGNLIIDGENAKGFNATQWTSIRKKYALVFQNPALLDSITVFENLMLGVRAHSLCSPSEERSRAKELLEQVELSEKILDFYPLEQSFGAQKRIALARALAVDPEFLLFDEPTTGLDPFLTKSLNALMEFAAKKLNKTLVVVSHDISSALRLSDRILLLDNAKIQVDGKQSEFVASTYPLAQKMLRGIHA